MAKAKPPVGRPFAKGNPGRKPGSKNKVTVLREGLMAALNLEGGVEYLRQQAREHPKAFLAALARANPAQLEIEHRGSIEHVVRGMSDDQIRAELESLRREQATS